jgi:hypothetical protein
MTVLATADSGTMRIVSTLAVSAVFAGGVPTKTTAYYALPGIERIGKNLYQSTKVIIETRACLHLPVDDEDALLKYLGPGEYEIVWEDRSTCEVERVTLGDTLPILRPRRHKSRDHSRLVSTMYVRVAFMDSSPWRCPWVGDGAS